MKILLTGACGIVGRETVGVLVGAGHDVHTFDLDNKVNRHQFKRMMQRLEPSLRHKVFALWGNLTDLRAVGEACRDVDAVIHLGALIPPAADRLPLDAYYVNVAATEMLVRALERTNPRASLVFTSSISVYGDRRENPLIYIDDELKPNGHDWYGQQKVLAERIIRNSSLAWNILRLTYIVSTDKLQMDPLMFAMPLDTSIEICHAQDVARALCSAAEGLASGLLVGRTFQIAGGLACRTTYRAYLQKMFALFGMGEERVLPENLWSKEPFHCGFMDTTESEAVLRYQQGTLATYYAEVARVSALSRFFIKMFRPIAWAWIISSSPLQPKKLDINRIAKGMSSSTTVLIARMRELMAAMVQSIEARKRLSGD